MDLNLLGDGEYNGVGLVDISTILATQDGLFSRTATYRTEFSQTIFLSYLCEPTGSSSG